MRVRSVVIAVTAPRDPRAPTASERSHVRGMIAVVLRATRAVDQAAMTGDPHAMIEVVRPATIAVVHLEAIGRVRNAAIIVVAPETIRADRRETTTRANHHVSSTTGNPAGVDNSY
jgi:hypothetical protein